MRARAAILVAVLAWLVSVASAARSEPPADPKTAAFGHFQIGVELVDARAWDSALAEFSRSRELFPTKNALKNAALCLRELGRYDEALDMYDELLKSFGAEVSPADRKPIDEDMARIAQHVGFISIESDPVGALVVVDGGERGTTPLALPLRATEGKHAVRVHKEGFAPFETRVDVAAGTTRKVSVSLAVAARVGKLRVAERLGRVFEVKVDGSVVGTTPWEGTLSTGEHTVALQGESDFGASARGVSIETGRTTEASLTAVLLPGQLRIDPTPASARVFVDGRKVATGAWAGELSSGPHRVDATAEWSEPERLEVIVSSRTPQAVRPSLERVRRVYLDAFGGIGLGQTGARNVPNCAGGGCVGNFGGFRLGLLLAQHVGVELFVIGGNVPREAQRTLTVSVNGVPTTSSTYKESADVGLFAGGVSAHYRFFDRTPLTLRLWAGALRGTAWTAASGQFAGAPDYGHGGNSVVFYSPVFGPEVRFGYRVSRAIMADVGVAALLLFVPGTRPDTGPAVADNRVALPPGPYFAGGRGVFFPITVGLRVDF
jgi:hypothetical protein